METQEAEEKAQGAPNQHLPQAPPSAAGHRFRAGGSHTTPALGTPIVTPVPPELWGCQHSGIRLQATNSVEPKPPTGLNGSITCEKGRYMLLETLSCEQT